MTTKRDIVAEINDIVNLSRSHAERVAVQVRLLARVRDRVQELEAALRNFVAYYNNERFHESLNNVTPADVYYGRDVEVVSERERIKRRTMKLRKNEYRAALAA